MKKIAMYIGSVFICVASTAHASDLYLKMQEAPVAGSGSVGVDIMISATSTEINAVEGVVSFPQEKLALRAVSTGDSIIPLWILSPNLKESQNGTVVFSGVIPGGYEGREGKIFTLYFDATADGTASIDLKNAKVFLHNGEGTEDRVNVRSFTTKITKSVTSVAPESTRDTTGPESFTPTIEASPLIFDGKYFLVFSTVDKGVGIDHYEVLEVRKGFASAPQGAWREAESPYLLEDQTLGSDIYVRAVDRSGNFRIAKVGSFENKGKEPNENKGDSQLIGYGFIVLFVMIILGGILIRKVYGIKKNDT